jgi:AcrR family transcriptional regulator
MSEDTTPAAAWSESLGHHKARQSDQIALTALHIVATEGMPALSMSALARRAGVSRQTLYRYFPDVESVLTHAMASSSIEPHLEPVTSAETPIEQLEAFVALVLEAAAAGHPPASQYERSLPPEARQAVRDHEQQVEELVVGIITEGVANGSFSPDLVPEVDGALLYRFILSAHDLAAATGETADLIEHVIRSVHRLVNPR